MQRVYVFQSSNFDFLISCHKIIIDELQSPSILVLLYFVLKILVLLYSVESFYPVYLYSWSMVAFGDVIWKLGKSSFVT